MVERGARGESEPLRIVFFGSPDFAVPALRALAGSERFAVALVVTQGAKTPSPVERAAAELGLPVYKPETLRDPAARAPLAAAGADLFVVAAFGLIFRQRTLEIPQLGSINIHPSLLPKYRGASPIVAAIAAGDRETGVSLMVMDSGIDTGAVVSIERAAVDPEDTTESLGARLAAVGAAQAVRDIPRWAAGELIAEPQDDTGASLTRTLIKADGWLDWSRPAIVLERHVRAMWPWPRAWTTVAGTPLQVHAARVLDLEAELGAVIPERKRLIVGTGTGALELTTVEPAGRRVMSGAAYLNGLRAPLLRLGDYGGPGEQRPLIEPIEAVATG
jgi:methionyl-tRNA formyltransferase